MKFLQIIPVVVALVAGLVMSISWLHEAWFGAIWVAMVLHMSFVTRDSRVASTVQTWVFGTIALCCSFYWAIDSLAYTLDMERSDLGPRLVFAGLILWESVPFACLGWLVAKQHQSFGILWLAPLGWIALERFWPKVFPWSFAHSQTAFLEILQVGELGGVYLVSAIFLYACLGLASQFRTERRQYRIEAAISLTLLLGTVTYGALRIRQLHEVSSPDTVRVGVVQIDPSWVESTEKMRKASDALGSGIDLFIWPESSFGSMATSINSLEEIVQDIAVVRLPFINVEPAKRLGASLLVGGRNFNPDSPEEGPYWQTAFLFNKNGGIGGRYHKRHLIPIGEYVPFENQFPFLHELAQLPDYMTFGSSDAPIVDPRGPAIGVLICYEDLVENAARKTVIGGAQFLVCMINASAFETPAALEQHRRLSLFRAIENRRYFVRCAGTGISCVIDPTGKQIKSLGPLEEGAFAQDIPLLDQPTVYQHIGYLFPWFALILVVLKLSTRREQLIPNAYNTKVNA
ncbi:MAG: apolipoprotein N-acyltransferase [Pirellulaceae bacterium]|nr:apolipoprotein N-acyltransferase [Pirellulaceae bacterium]